MRYVLFSLLFLCIPLQKSFAAPASPPPAKEITASSTVSPPKPQLIDVKKVFVSSPVIYGFLLTMSIASMAVWIYSLATFRTKEIMPESFKAKLKNYLETQKYDLAKQHCLGSPNVLASLILAGLTTRHLGAQVMIDSMKSEGKRASTPLWQRLSFLNDIAVVAPMLGLLGTVIGMFYAFYDVNRSIESINALFDGLGISVGTTVVGLVVAILAMLFSTTLKYRLIRVLSLVENEALCLSSLIQSKRD